MSVDPRLEETATQERSASGSSGPPVPGIVHVFHGDRPTLHAHPVERAVTLGRSPDVEVSVTDTLLSRQHAEVTWDGTALMVRDLGSHNGTFVDGAAVGGAPTPGRVLRAGDSIFLLGADIRRFQDAAVDVDDEAVVGPTLRVAFEEVRLAAGASPTLYIAGETGAGKELAARLFHRAAGRKGPFVAVNCATIPPALAESLLFGARRGAYTGAAENEGYFVAASGGTLFLDEIGELPLEVQAKLLRVLETREVTPLGATRARPVDLHVCAATHRELREQVARETFRPDLYFRIGKPSVVIPPLRERPEDVPWLAQAALARAEPGLSLHVNVVEALLLRPWPGNVRELMAEVANAGRRAAAQGKKRVTAEDLSPAAGQSLGVEEARESKGKGASDEEIMAALRREQGNVTAAARALGIHRNQLRRWLVRRAIDPLSLRGDR